VATTCWDATTIRSLSLETVRFHEAINNASELKSKMLVVLNDNEMSICPRVGGVGSYFDKLRTNRVYSGVKNEVVSMLNKVPVLGDPTERMLFQIKEGVKAGLHGGMMFEEFGFKYFGPIDGHDIGVMKKYLNMVSNRLPRILFSFTLLRLLKHQRKVMRSSMAGRPPRRTPIMRVTRLPTKCGTMTKSP